MQDPREPLLPPLGKIRDVTRGIALAVSRAAQEDGVAENMGDAELESRIDASMWTPAYC